jgi:hypothetical protein
MEYLAHKLQFPLISTDYAENWPEPVQLYVQRLTLNLLMSYIYGALSKARHLTSYIYGRDFLLGILLLEPYISLIYA